MSVKIYTAWRWHKKHGLMAVSGKIERAAKEEVRKTVRKMVRDANIQDNRSARYKMSDLLTSITKTAFVSLRRDPFDLNSVFMVRETPTHYLCIPTDGWNYKFEYMKSIKEVEAYGYWDNTDMPEGMTTREWKARGKVWDKYWNPGRPTIQFSALDITDPSMEFLDMLVPDMFSSKKITSDYWEDK